VVNVDTCELVNELLDGILDCVIKFDTLDVLDCALVRDPVIDSDAVDNTERDPLNILDGTKRDDVIDNDGVIDIV
jgi:hypothetical protein